MHLLLRCIVSRNILISIRNAQSLATVCDSTCSTYDTLKLCIIIIIIIMPGRHCLLILRNAYNWIYILCSHCVLEWTRGIDGWNELEKKIAFVVYFLSVAEKET